MHLQHIDPFELETSIAVLEQLTIAFFTPAPGTRVDVLESVFTKKGQCRVRFDLGELVSPVRCKVGLLDFCLVGPKHTP